MAQSEIKPVAWRWEWAKTHDPDGWCYQDTPPKYPELQIIEPLYNESALAAAREAGRRAGIEEAAKEVEACMTRADPYCEVPDAIRALLDAKEPT